MKNPIENILEKAYQAALKINQPAGRCAALTQIAEAYSGRRDSIHSETRLAEAQKIAETLKYPHEKARSLAALAAVLFKNGQTDQARAQFSRAVLLARAAESPSQTVEALYRIAGLYNDSRFSRESLLLLEELHKLVVDPPE